MISLSKNLSQLFFKNKHENLIVIQETCFQFGLSFLKTSDLFKKRRIKPTTTKKNAIKILIGEKIDTVETSVLHATNPIKNFSAKLDLILSLLVM